MLAANFFIKMLAWFFISALDWVAYMLLSVSYTIFYAVSQLDIFSTEGGANIYNEICARFYSILSIVMIFVFAYFLIMMIIDPDGGNKKASTQMVKDVVLSIILVIVLPTIFGYMSLFQKHVLTNNTIGALILGGNGTIDKDPGKQISMIVFTAFFHPQGTMYSDYFDNDGKLIEHDQAMAVCKGPHENNDGEEASTDDDVCTAWVEGLEAWSESSSWGIGAISGKAKLRDTVGDEGGMEYIWILSTVAAIAVAYFFFSYTLDVGTRAVKLGFLQIIAPIPVMLKMFPQTKKTFDTWFAEIKKSYLEIFFRLAIIFFIVKLCTMVPEFLNAIFNGTSGVEGNFLIKAIATVCLILGLLKFAKEAPGLLKTIFSSSTGLFAGLDWKPGVKRRISENEYAMKGMSTIGGAVGGAVGTGYMAFRNSLKSSDVQGSDPAAMIAAAGKGLLSVPRGVISGGKAGFKNTPQEFNLKNMAGTFNSGATGGQASYIHRENSKVFNVKEAELEASKNGTTVIEELRKQALERGWNPRKEDLMDAIKGESKLLSGDSINSSAATDTINKATKAISDVFSWTESKTKAYTDAYKDLEKKAIKEGTVEYNGVTYSAHGAQTVFDEDAYKAALGGRSETYDRAAYDAECKAKGLSPVSALDPTAKYNPSTGKYEKGFDIDAYIASQSHKKYNPASRSYEDHFDPKTAYTKQTKSISELKKAFDAQKNNIVADTLTDSYKEGTATYMATLRQQLSKEIGNLGSETVREINDTIKTKTNGQITTVDAFLKKLSDAGPNAKITATDVEVLGKIKGTLEEKGKNISIQAQIQQQAKQNGANANNKGGDKPKS